MDPSIITTVTGLAGAAKATVEAVRAIASKAKGDREAEKDASEALGLVTDLQARLFQLQEVLLSLQEENRQLREEIREEKVRLAERERYQSQKMGPSLLLVNPDHPDIFYCPTCMETKKGAISLQPRAGGLGNTIRLVAYHCNCCGTTFPIQQPG